MEAETVEPQAEGYFAGLRSLCDASGALLILDEIITGFRWHERGAQFVYNIKPDLCVFGKALGNGFPVSALAGRADVMRLGGFVDDADRVFLLSQTAGAQHWALAAMLAVINTYQEESIAERLHRVGSELRRGVEQVVARPGLSAHFQLGAGTATSFTPLSTPKAGPARTSAPWCCRSSSSAASLPRPSSCPPRTTRRRSTTPSTRSPSSCRSTSARWRTACPACCGAAACARRSSPGLTFDPTDPGRRRSRMGDGAAGAGARARMTVVVPLAGSLWGAI